MKRIGYRAFVQEAFAKGADYVQPTYDGMKGVNRVLVSAVAVCQRYPKVIAVWVKDKGIVWQCP